MESSQGGLVAIMFVTILVFGIAALITSMSSILNAGQYRSLDPKMISWVLLTLLIHLMLFWETVVIQQQDEWPFSSFLFLIAGPLLLYFATNTLLTNQDPEIQAFAEGHYQAVSKQFFLILSALMLWAFAIEFILGDGAILSGLADLSALALFVALAMARGEHLHARLTFAAWVLIIGLLMLAGFGIID